MRRYLFYGIFSIVCLLLLQSCVAFKDGLKNPNPIPDVMIKSFNGTYRIWDLERNSWEPNDYWGSENFFEEIDRKLLKDTSEWDTTSTRKFQLEIINKNHLQVKYVKDEKIIRTRIIKTKLEKDGYLYLKNKNVGFILIPYLAGAIDVKKTRMTLSEKGDLLFDVAHYHGGAFFFFIFLSWQNSSYRKTYTRVYQE